jgi:hypothetical protein
MTAPGHTSRLVVLFGAFALLAAMIFAATAGAQETTASRDADEAAFSASATKSFTKTIIKPQSGDHAVQAEVAKITAPNNPFSFKKTSKIVRINRIFITARMFDGDTGAGDLDENNLTLALDGINTGIELNRFRNEEADTRTNSGEPNHKRALKKALKKDGKLQATIIDATPGDNNEVNLLANFETKLEIRGKKRL